MVTGTTNIEEFIEEYELITLKSKKKIDMVLKEQM